MRVRVYLLEAIDNNNTTQTAKQTVNKGLKKESRKRRVGFFVINLKFENEFSK